MKISLRCHRCGCEDMRTYKYEQNCDVIGEIFCSRCGMLIVLAVGDHLGNFSCEFE